MANKVIFLTSGSSWTIPSDWNNTANTIEIIDGGGGFHSDGEGSWVGGDGGSYRKYVNVTLTIGATATYSIGAGSSSGAGGTSSHTGCNTPSVSFSGGIGQSDADFFSRGWGGGAAGPTSAGQSSNFGNGSAGGGSWTSTNSPTGAASVATAAPGAGTQLYGGGGSGQFDPESGGSNISGQDGIIVVTYTPKVITSGVGSSVGSGAATAVGRAIKLAAGSASGLSTATATSAPFSQGSGSASGTGAGAAVGSGLVPANQGVGAAVGAGTASGRSPSTAVGAAAGSSTTLGAGGARISAVGTAAGSSTTDAASISTAPGVGVAAGVALARASNYPKSRILLGRLPNNNYGMRVSIPNYDASSEPVDDQKLIFSSEWPDVMPIYLRGSFVHRSGAAIGTVVTQEVDYTTLGFVPFCDFVVRGNGDALPAGSDAYPSTQFYPYGALYNLPYWDGGAGNAYLRLNVTANKICARSLVRNINGQTGGLPQTWTIYYTIYRKQAQ